MPTPLYDRTHVVSVLESRGVAGFDDLARKIGVGRTTAYALYRGTRRAGEALKTKLHLHYGIPPAALDVPAEQPKAISS